MGGYSFVHWAVVAIVVMLLFGGGRLSRTMGDVGHGLRALRKGLAEEDTPERLPRPEE